MSDYSRVTFSIDGTGDPISLGWHEWISFNVESAVSVKSVPRATGVILYSGEEIGGGQINIKLNCFIVKSTREELESYIYTLITTLVNQKGTLTISRNGNTLILTDCYFKSLSQPDECSKTATIGMEFIKSV
jgi:hypothetical protein